MLDPTISDLHEVQNAVHVQLKTKQTKKPAKSRKSWDGWVKGQGPSIKYTTNYTLTNFLSLISHSLSPLSLTPSLLPSLTLPLSPFHEQISNTDNSRQQSMKKKKIFHGIKVAQRRQKYKWNLLLLLLLFRKWSKKRGGFPVSHQDGLSPVVPLYKKQQLSPSFVFMQ